MKFYLASLFLILTFFAICSIFFNAIFPRNKTSATDLCINSDLNEYDYEVLYIIEMRIRKRFILLILQDDINFYTSKFYWPKGYAYIHFSDFKHISQKFNEYLNGIISKDDFDCSLRYFIKTKIYFKK